MSHPSWQFEPGVRPRPAEGHKNEPPGPGVKEKKMRSNGSRIGKAVFGAANTITESMDFIDAFYEALPNKYKARTKRLYNGYGRPGQKFADPTPQQKLWALYRNWAHVDFTKAILNVGANQLTDLAAGRASQFMNRMQRRAGLKPLLSPGAGPTL